MSHIKFITDSAADIPLELQRQLGIQVLPFSIAADDREYLDGRDLSAKEFYALLDREKNIPTHAQLTPMTLQECYESVWADGYTDLIYTCINSKGSATYQNCLMAQKLFYQDHPEAEGEFRIHVLDARTYTMAYGYAVVEGARLAQKGLSVEEVLAFMQDWLNHVKILFTPMDLRFAKKSGRVSAAAAFVGDALGLKPIMSFPDGESKVLSKVRGDKKVLPTMQEMMLEDMAENSPYLCIFGSDDQRNEEFRAAMEEKIGYPPVQSYYIGGVIAINAGHNLIGLVYRTR